MRSDTSPTQPRDIVRDLRIDPLDRAGARRPEGGLSGLLRSLSARLFGGARPQARLDAAASGAAAAVDNRREPYLIR